MTDTNTVLAEVLNELPDVVEQRFAVNDGSGWLREFSRPVDTSPLYSYLWPYSGYVTGLIARGMLLDSAEARTRTRQALDRYDAFLDMEADPPGYNDYPQAEVKKDKFYDDNEWLGMDFVHASRLLDDPSLMEKARLTWDFAWSGWNDDVLEGGIWWQQGNFASKNTCSNGPAAVLAMMLFERTGEESFLMVTKQIMSWLEKLYDPHTGVYHDNLRVDGSIDSTKYTYNAGTPIHAAALLYRATDDSAWRTFAQQRADAALKHFVNVNTAVPTIPATPWFNAVLFRGLSALQEVVPNATDKHRQPFVNALVHAWTHLRDRDGLLPSDWSAAEPNDTPKSILDQGAALEIAALELASA